MSEVPEVGGSSFLASEHDVILEKGRREVVEAVDGVFLETGEPVEGRSFEGFDEKLTKASVFLFFRKICTSHRDVKGRDVGGGVVNIFEGWETEFIHLSEPDPRYLLCERRPERFGEDALDLQHICRHVMDLRGDIEDRLL